VSGNFGDVHPDEKIPENIGKIPGKNGGGKQLFFSVSPEGGNGKKGYWGISLKRTDHGEKEVWRKMGGARHRDPKVF